MPANQSIYGQTSSVRALTSVVRNSTVSGDTVDRNDTNCTVLFVILTATLTDGTQTFSIEDSDDGSAWGAAAAGSTLGTAVTAATDDDKVFELGYIGPKRYCRLKIVGTGATGGVSGAVAIKYGGRKPVTR